ncbi:MAG: hypothetical protein L0I76_25330 [Pseudonocardia sp.]|nr:hypothetical protein [Pseudonocardia sp.]
MRQQLGGPDVADGGQHRDGGGLVNHLGEPGVAEIDELQVPAGCAGIAGLYDCDIGHLMQDRLPARTHDWMLDVDPHPGRIGFEGHHIVKRTVIVRPMLRATAVQSLYAHRTPIRIQLEPPGSSLRTVADRTSFVRLTSTPRM